MKKTKFIQDAKVDPQRFYRHPFDVIRDRRLSNEDRLEILGAWEQAARNPEDTGEAVADERLQQLRRVREELEKSLEEDSAPTR